MFVDDLIELVAEEKTGLYCHAAALTGSRLFRTQSIKRRHRRGLARRHYAGRKADHDGDALSEKHI